MKPATLKNLDIFEGRQGNIEERQYSSKYAIMESAAAFVADFVPAGLGIVGVYNGDTDRADLYCDDCYIAVFGKVGMPRSHLS